MTFSKVVRPYLYIAPALLFLGLFIYWPIVYSLFLSFHKWNFLSSDTPFVGLSNYISLWKSDEFKNSVQVTSLFVLFSVPLRLAIAIAVANQLTGKGLFVRAMRGAFFLPYITGAVAVALIWSWIFNGEYGLLNEVLRKLGIQGPIWLQSPKLALYSVAMVNVWKQIGYDTVIYIAGIQRIPASYYEAAAIDGASRWQTFRKITFPLVSPITFFLLIVAVIASFQVFTIVDVMTGGGPAYGTDVLVYMLYRTSFFTFDIGKGSSLAIYLFLLLLIVTVVKTKVIGKKGEL